MKGTAGFAVAFAFVALRSFLALYSMDIHEHHDHDHHEHHHITFHKHSFIHSSIHPSIHSHFDSSLGCEPVTKMAVSSSAEFSVCISILANASFPIRWDEEGLKIGGLRSSDTVRYLKSQIFFHGHILPENQHIYFMGQILEDGKTLSDYNIKAWCADGKPLLGYNRNLSLLLTQTYAECLSFLAADGPFFDDDLKIPSPLHDDEDDDDDDVKISYDEDDNDDDNVEPESEPEPESILLLKNCFAEVAPPSADSDDDDDDDVECSPPLKKRKHDDDGDEGDEDDEGDAHSE